MKIFIDTSALIALLYAEDENHLAASKTWEPLINGENVPFCTNYILVETFAVLQRRFGVPAIRMFHEAIVPVLQIYWITPEIHGLAAGIVLAINRRHLSFVDCTSFEAMRRLDIRTAFAFDPHFNEQGFECIPTPE